MGTSIYQIAPTIPNLPAGQPGCELTDMTRALYHARELAMNRMEAEADALGADGIVGVRLTVKKSKAISKSTARMVAPHTHTGTVTSAHPPSSSPWANRPNLDCDLRR